MSEIDDRHCVQDVSTGLPRIIVPLKTLDAVKRARISRNRYFEFIKRYSSSILKHVRARTWREVKKRIAEDEEKFVSKLKEALTKYR